MKTLGLNQETLVDKIILFFYIDDFNCRRRSFCYWNFSDLKLIFNQIQGIFMTLRKLGHIK